MYAQRARQVSGERETGAALYVSHAEISHPHVAALVQKQVGRFDITVDDSLIVRVTQRLGRLNSQAGTVRRYPRVRIDGSRGTDRSDPEVARA